MKNRTTVTIGTQSYTLVSEENPSYVYEIAAHVTQELSTINEGAHLSMADASTLAAVNVTDKFFKERAAADNLRRQLKECLDEVSRLKSELLDLKHENLRLQREVNTSNA